MGSDETSLATERRLAEFMAELDRIRVLHVDDDPDLREVAALHLERESNRFDVFGEPSADDALDRLAADGIDCVVSDYQMPGMDGLEFLDAVREDYPDLPFLLYTGKGSEEIASRAISAGVTDYIQKESGTDHYSLLANRIENAVERERARRQVHRGFTAMETAREGISLLDGDGRFIYVNDAYADIVRYSRSELIGQHWELLYPEEHVDSVREEVLPSIPDHGRWRGETVYVRGDGERIMVDHALAYADDETLICLVDDVSNSVHDGPLVAEEAFVECVLDALEDVFYVLDTEGNVVRVNERAVERTGFDVETLTSMHATEVIADGDNSAVEAAIQETLETGTSTLEASIRTSAGRTIPHEFRTRRLADPDGRTIGLVGIGRDVTERRRRERRLERQANQFDTFSSVLSHDLANPLTVIDHRVQLLRDVADPAEIDDHADAIDRSVQRLTRLIDELADVMQEGELVSDIDRVDLTESVESVWAALDTGEASLDVADSVTVLADEQALKRMFDNLLENAIEHGGSGVTVTVGSLSDGFYVADDGPGIEPEMRDDVFEPRVSSDEEGSGFGLVSVRQIAAAHGWEVSVTESESGGARFEIRDVMVVT